MQGVSINDVGGRRVLSTHFQQPLRASIAIDAALATTETITWVPALDIHRNGHVSDEGDSEEEDTDAMVDQPWRNDGTAQQPASRHAPKGQAVCQIERNGLRYISPIAPDIDPVLPLTFLDQLHQVLESYIGGPVTEASLKDNFDIVLALLEEMMASGRPLLSQASQLRELVMPPSQLLAKVALNAANVAGLTVASRSAANALLASPLPWRRQGIKYSSNEIYFDLVENLDFVLDKSGRILAAGITGEIACRSRLSGMPDLTLSFTDPSQLEDCAFHSSVRYARWNKDKVASFVPPDGAFTLMHYQIGGLMKSSALTASSASALAMLPLAIKPAPATLITQGSQGGTFRISLSARTPPSRPLTNLRISLPLGKGANGVTASLSGGSLGTENGLGGGGAGRWDVVQSLPESGGPTLVWTIDSLSSLDRPAEIQGQFYSSPAGGGGGKVSPAFTITFDSLESGFSGMRISSLKIAGDPYSIYKGVRLKGRGSIEVRTV